ncbi:MAG: DUF86 domain-containing protein [Candidatus Hydrogenedentes bacterium]|nr:DUF86 domain-containing protein [Candidatus Hydrogenedentota bacterium]
MSKEFRQRHPEIPWRRLIRVRNRVIHAYFDVNLRIIWTTTQEDLPELICRIQACAPEAKDPP